VPIVLKSGSLNLLKPSRPVQTCNGIALPLPFCLKPTQLLLYTGDSQTLRWCTTNIKLTISEYYQYFCILIKHLKFERRDDRENDLYNAARNIAF
jgi:hypothetical protein